MQLSDRITALAITKMKHFVSQNVAIKAAKVIGYICGHLGSPEKRLSSFLNFCKEKMLTELNMGASSFSDNRTYSSTSNAFEIASMGDASFHYYQCIVNSITINSGKHILAYQDAIIDILEQTFSKSESKRGHKWSAKLLKNVLNSLLTIYPEEYRSHDPETWNSKGILHFLLNERIPNWKLQSMGRNPRRFKYQLAHSVSGRNIFCRHINRNIQC
jgi:hypothetical protein